MSLYFEKHHSQVEGTCQHHLAQSALCDGFTRTNDQVTWPCVLRDVLVIPIGTFVLGGNWRVGSIVTAEVRRSSQLGRLS